MWLAVDHLFTLGFKKVQKISIKHNKIFIDYLKALNISGHIKFSSDCATLCRQKTYSYLSDIIKNCHSSSHKFCTNNLQTSLTVLANINQLYLFVTFVLLLVAVCHEYSHKWDY